MGTELSTEPGTSNLRDRRILFVFATLELGGAERQGLTLARHLAQAHGARIQVIGFGRPGLAAELCQAAGLPWRVVPLRLTSRNRLRHRLLPLAWYLFRTRPHAILAYTTYPGAACALAWRWSGARLFIWNHRDEGLDRLDAALERDAVRRTPWFTANSSGGVSFLQQVYGVPSERLRLIRNGVLLEQPLENRRSWRARLAVDDQTPVAVMLGNLHGNKDHATLLRAFHLVLNCLSADAPRPILALAGRPENTAESIAELARSLGIAGQVRFLGPVKDVSGLLYASDVGVLSSRSEGLPNAVLECMAAGLPVVATDIAGTREALGPAAAAWLAPGNDAEALASRLSKLLGEPDLRLRTGTANQKRASEVFAPSRMLEAYEALLREALLPRTGPVAQTAPRP